MQKIDYTVTTPVLSSFLRACTILDSVHRGERGQAVLDGLSDNDRLELTEICILFGKLFAVGEDVLGDEERWELLLCRQLPWFGLALARLEAIQSPEQLAQSFIALVGFEEVYYEELDQIIDSCSLISETIANHLHEDLQL